MKKLHIHQITRITLSGSVHPNHFDEAVSICDPLILSGMTAYLVQADGNIARLDLNFFKRA